MSAKTGEYTLGVEEEYQVIDAESRGLDPRGGRVLERARQTLGDQVVPELRASQIEVVPPVCRTLADVRAALLRLQRGVIAAADEEGRRIAAASTHPFSYWQEQPITPDERYRRLVESYQQLILEQLAFGFHVHVGLDDREAALGVMNHLRVWLAPLLALSANSPFWLGEDTGYASYRTQVWGRLPAAGPPASFASLAEHDALIEALVQTGGVLDAASVYWDVRLPEKLETVEIRVADVPSRVDEAVMVAGLSRAGAGLPREGRSRGALPGRPAGAAARRPLARLALRVGRGARGRGGPTCYPGAGDDGEDARLRASGARGTRRLRGSLVARRRHPGERQRREAPASGLRTDGPARRGGRRADRGDGPGNGRGVDPTPSDEHEAGTQRTTLCRKVSAAETRPSAHEMRWCRGPRCPEAARPFVWLPSE